MGVYATNIEGVLQLECDHCESIGINIYPSMEENNKTFYPHHKIPDKHYCCKCDNWSSTEEKTK